MEADESQRVVPFQLQFDKPIASQIKIAEWNPEKDLLAMVTEDSKLLLHRFNWQRLWTTSPGKSITSICWRPDGKAIAVGLEDGTISLHDVENGKLLRNMKFHNVSVVCLNWEEDRKLLMDGNHKHPIYEDRTARFFPPAPRVPRTPGLVPGDGSGFMDENDDSFRELFDSSHQQFDILCSGDKDGNICFNIFGIFPIGRVNIHDLAFRSSLVGNHVSCQLMDASICKVALSRDICYLIVLCCGVLTETGSQASDNQMSRSDLQGFHCLVLDSTIFSKRKNELHQVALQASNVEHLIEVIRRSLAVMSKQWSDVMHVYHEKFNALSSLIIDHGIDSSPQEEFLSLLGGARTSPPIHQFLANSLGEAGLKRVAKVVCGAGKELQTILLDHLQPAAEIIGFRMGELRGLSRWRARYQGIGLDEKLIDNATEKAGMLHVQIERFSRILSSVVQQFSNFFNWLLKCVKVLMSEPIDQLPPFSSELVIIFLKFLYDQDPVGTLLQEMVSHYKIEVDLETKQRVRELAHFGGFSDSEYLERTLAEEFQQMESCFKEALEMPLVTVSGRILCKDMLPLFPVSSLPNSSYFPESVSYHQEASTPAITHEATHQRLTDYTSFLVPDETFPNITNCIGIMRGLMHDMDNLKSGHSSLEVALLRVPDGYHCVDLSLYKEEQIVLLLNEVTATSEGSGTACMMIIKADDLPFVSISRSSILRSWHLHELQDSVAYLHLENEKVREISHSVVAPLAVSASRGVACVFAARKRALVYILEEDEDEDEMTDSE
ncbi:Anaphase-promoting complex (APC), subunit 4 [Handroanthus impetiginosus]|uniref:Anaphase-promoting complex subunit 4 n=1 Tax=Handroanthus impetiginosus TaxID=429701 RepID=A0A2G9GP87_9LAMI|nr:Anaphase-promoting complex (APC), subunit 4 [Handroanthus impetiginosus]